jgi:hypothetical protein
MRQLLPKARPEAKLWPEAKPEARLWPKAGLSSMSSSVFSIRYVKPSHILDVVNHHSPSQNIVQSSQKIRDIFVQSQRTINLEAGPWSSMDEIVGTVQAPSDRNASQADLTINWKSLKKDADAIEQSKINQKMDADADH